MADEPVSSLDASVRGEILKLLLGLRDDFGIAMLVVTHDLGLAWTIADRVAVMYLGRIVEIGPAEDVLTKPLHPYTQSAARGGPRGRGPRRARSCPASARPDAHPRGLPLPSPVPRGRLGRGCGGRRRGPVPRRGPRADRAPARTLRRMPPGGRPARRRGALDHLNLGIRRRDRGWGPQRADRRVLPRARRPADDRARAPRDRRRAPA